MNAVKDLAQRANKTRLRLLFAGIRCIRRLGIANTTMEEVAAEAGCTRITLYRKFGNRENFILELIAFRLDAFNRRFVRQHGAFSELATSLEAYLLASTRAARTSPITREIIRGPMDFIETGSPLFAVMEQLWRPALAHAQATGQLSAATDIGDAVKWILIIQATLSRLTNEAKLSEPGIKSLIRSFVLPGFGILSARVERG